MMSMKSTLLASLATATLVTTGASAEVEIIHNPEPTNTDFSVLNVSTQSPRATSISATKKDGLEMALDRTPDKLVRESALEFLRLLRSINQADQNSGNMANLEAIEVAAAKVAIFFSGFKAKHSFEAIESARNSLKVLFDDALSKAAWASNPKLGEHSFAHYSNIKNFAAGI